MRRFASLGGVLFLIVGVIFFSDILGHYLWKRVATTQALRGGKLAPDIALYQNHDRLLVRDGPDYYLIGDPPGTVGLGSPHDFRQLPADTLYCSDPTPRVVEMNSSKLEIDPHLVQGKQQVEFTNGKNEKIKVHWKS
jgi:hypothetical protein